MNTYRKHITRNKFTLFTTHSNKFKLLKKLYLSLAMSITMILKTINNTYLKLCTRSHIFISIRMPQSVT